MPTRLRRPLMSLGLVLFVQFALSACAQLQDVRTQPVATSDRYDDLIVLFKEFRTAAVPAVREGVPDYSDEAMAQQVDALRGFKQRLDAIDDSGWPIAQRVDYMLVWAEMNGLAFEHRVMRPWKRDPAFYSTTSLGFGPKIYDAMDVPTLPVVPEQLEKFRTKLRAVPVILHQAKHQLTEVAGDLARLGIAQKKIEGNYYRRLAKDLAKHHPDLVGDAERAEAACEQFAAWLEENLPQWTRPAGVGKANYDWYLKHVLLLPYTSDEMRVIGEREYQRSITFLKIEEHRHRGMKMIAPATSMAEFERRRERADKDLLAWMKREDILDVPDYLVPAKNEGPYILPSDLDPEKPGPFEAPIKRHFFRQSEDRDPRPLRGHNVPGHLLDEMMMKLDKRPIRGTERLFFIDGSRAEGLAFYWEEFMQQAGFLDKRPKTREINYILQANRAARLLPELMMHSNAWTFDQALHSLTSRTPYWMEPDDQIALTDLELYLRQPGYGIGYYIGKVQLEALLAERAMEKGEAFDLKQFHADFLKSGMVPISLVRWEMLGRDEEIKAMRDGASIPDQ